MAKWLPRRWPSRTWPSPGRSAFAWTSCPSSCAPVAIPVLATVRPAARTASASRLFGFDPEGDYFRLTRELGYRRVNLAVPEESLVLQKALGAVPHTGGKRFEPTSEYAKTMTTWLQAGRSERSAHRADRGKHRDLPPRDAAGRGGRQAADDRPRPVQRRQPARRHRAGAVLQQQRQFGPRRAQRPGHRGESGRGLHSGPLRHQDRGQPGDRSPGRTEVLATHGRSGQLHRRTGQRQAAQAPHPAQRYLQRSRLPAACDYRHHRRLAYRGRISGLPRRQIARQTGKARRSPAGAKGLCRNLGHEVGRVAHGPLGRGQANQLQVDLSLLDLADRADRRECAAGPDRAATAGRPRRHVLVAAN